MRENNVVAVTVTYNRVNTLEKTIDALTNQNMLLDKIIVVDNNSSEEHKKILKDIEKSNDLVEVVWLNENLGGAGGFYHGMKVAKEKYNPNWYWIMDDDAYPTKDCLKNLLEYKDKLDNIGFLAPAIYGIDNKKYQMYHHKMISKYKTNDITAVAEYEDLENVTNIEANAFVGPLFSRKAVEELGLPKGELFIYGDDTEYTYRVTRKYRGYVIKDAIINHQDPPYQGKAVAPEGWWKEYYMFRNRYLFIDEFGVNGSEKIIAKVSLTMHLLRRILASSIKSQYKYFRKIRIKVLTSAINDGINGNEGRIINPKEYIDSIKNIRKKNKL